MSEAPKLPEFMLTYPTVFAVADEYQIYVPFSESVLMTVQVGDRTFYDDCNGVLRSNTLVHKVIVPMALLDAAKSYTVSYRKVIDRKPYRPELEDERSLTLPFRPVPTEGAIKIYHVSDAHNLVDEPIAAGRYYGDELDLLVMNGDIPNHSGRIENFNAIYEIASGITGGQCPVAYARGNHDCRGIHAEDMPQYIPTYNGRTYFTFRVGSIWGIVLDCGEDKLDTHEEYGGTVCFHEFRLAETDFIKKVIANAATEYAAPGVKHRLVISHVNFWHRESNPIFDIEDEVYTEWAALMREGIKPDLSLFGHHHRVEICQIGGPMDGRGQYGLALIGSRPTAKKFGHAEDTFTGCGVTILPDGKFEIVFNRETGEVLQKTVI